MPQHNRPMFHHTTAERAAAGRNGARSRHGESVVWIDGQPVSLQRLSAEIGVSVERLYDRVYRHRKRGEPITLQALSAPLRPQAPPKKLTETERLRRLLR